METTSQKPAKPVKYKWTRRLIFAVMVLGTLAMLLFAEENWRGSRAWKLYKAELEAKGERFDIASVTSKKVSDDQNLALLPFFAGKEDIHFPKDLDIKRDPAWRFGTASELTTWARGYGSNTENPKQAAAAVLTALQKQEPLLAELPGASARTQCRFNLDYEHWHSDTNVQSSVLESFVPVKKFLRILSLRSMAEVAAGQTDDAIRDIDYMFTAEAGVAEEPLLISQLVAYAGAEMMLQPIAQGLASHRWTDAQLLHLQAQLLRLNMLASMTNALRGERNICVNPVFNEGVMKPKGWDRLEQLNLNRSLKESILPCIDASAHRIKLDAVKAHFEYAQAQTNHSKWLMALVYHNIFTPLTFGAFPRAFEKTGFAQAEIDEVAIACALERYRLAETKYPDTLSAITPRFAASLPPDPMTGQSYHYRAISTNRFILYSVGWNGTDDGGKIVSTEPKGMIPARQSIDQGDWVFEYPE